MKRPSLIRRLGGATILLMQAVLPIVLPIADGRLEVAALHDTVHVEPAGKGGCTPAHDDLACQICRTMTSGADPTPPGALRLETTVSFYLLPSADLPIATLGCPTLLNSRAPPHLA